MGGFGGAGGFGGTGGTGTTTGAGGQRGDTYPITGRAGLGCYCGLGAGAPDMNAPLAFAAALLAAAVRRRRRS
jgi:MYXO-CTERM domain-containing protein